MQIPSVQQVRFGEWYQERATAALTNGLMAFAQQSHGIPVQVQANDQFTLLNQNLSRIATSMEAMVQDRQNRRI